MSEEDLALVSIPVDFNSLARGRLVAASLRRVAGKVDEGQRVIASAPLDGMEYFAVVHSIEGKTVYLSVDWQMNLFVPF